LLAKIDDSVYRAQRNSAKATLVRAQADLGQYKAKLTQAEADWTRAQRLRPDKDPKATVAPASKTALEFKPMSDSDYDLARANYSSAVANVDVGKAAIEQAQATLDLADTNLAYTVIRSPVDGVIVDRRMNVGQTVVAALNAPSLFLLAKDLSKMEVWASVNEADIGRIREGMKVTFRVDAFPGKKFEGVVDTVRLNATMTQNVVTYTVVVNFDNRKYNLLPYLTANVEFELENRPKVLQVPNAALRWKPRVEQVAPDIRDKVAATLSKTGPGGPGGPGGKPGGAPGARPGGDAAAKPAGRPDAAKTAPQKQDRGRLWIKDQDGGYVRPVEVQIGATDGTNTEVSGEEVQEGMDVVVGEIRQQAGGDDAKNPFVPTFFRGKKT
jgi:HlyD family secretion protein